MIAERIKNVTFIKRGNERDDFFFFVIPSFQLFRIPEFKKNAKKCPARKHILLTKKVKKDKEYVLLSQTEKLKKMRILHTLWKLTINTICHGILFSGKD